MTSGLTNLSPLTITGETLPTPQLFNNIPMLHSILEEVVEDWMRAVDPYQKQVDAAGSDDAKIFAVISGIADLRLTCPRCLYHPLC